MSKPPALPKFKCLRPMRPDDPFYRRGYFVGALVLRPKSPPKVKLVPSRIKGDPT